MEQARRVIGKETARKLAMALNLDHRMLLWAGTVFVFTRPRPSLQRRESGDNLSPARRLEKSSPHDIVAKL